MIPLRLILIAYILVAVTPLIRPSATGNSSPAPADFPGWPSHFQHHRLTPLEMPPKVMASFASFPGKVQGFDSAGGRWILRWIYQPSRQVHPATHCFRGAGYAIEPRGLERDPYEIRWSHFQASRDGTTLTVHEQISDSRGNVWTDVSSWYWDAVRGATQGPWWAVTRIQEIKPQPTKDHQ